MLYYTEVGLSPYEVPGETAICIYISGCCNHCPNCHYPLLQRKDYGDILMAHYREIINLFGDDVTCVCFLGEGENSSNEHQEFRTIVQYAKSLGLKTCLYCGRNTDIENWMKIFDYIKLGSYKEEYGGLDSKTTNQRMHKKEGRKYRDITDAFFQYN